MNLIECLLSLKYCVMWPDFECCQYASAVELIFVTVYALSCSYKLYKSWISPYNLYYASIEEDEK